MKKISNPFRRKHLQDYAPEDCDHSWILFSKSYAPPRKEIPEGITDVLAEKALLGVTTYTWSCNLCGALRKNETLGSDGNHLEEILEKAEKFGVQYVERDSKVFAIARVPADDTRIPIK